MDISLFFAPLEISNSDFQEGTLGRTAKFHHASDFPELEGIEIALIGVKEDRKSEDNKGCKEAPDHVRKQLYQLFSGNYNLKLADLGNISAGHTVEDTYFAMSSAVLHLIKHNITPIIIGGSQDLTYANYLAYEQLEQTVNIVTIDPRLDIGGDTENITSKAYLQKIIMHQPNYLFNYSNIGYQSYFVDQKLLELMSKLYFDAYRLGEVRSSPEETEPVLRNADIVSFDVAAIRYADSPGCKNAGPNAFYGEEACRIARYAGMSDKVSSVGFYEINPESDREAQTAKLTAQMIWYFIEGFYNRKKDYPAGEKTDYLKYRVVIRDSKHELIFYKSSKTERWWMDVPFPAGKKNRYERHHLVPCSYKDYQTACNDEMPDRWWITYQKLC
jgi:formiminoglutamase